MTDGLLHPPTGPRPCPAAAFALLILASALFGTGCATLPSAGPSVSEIQDELAATEPAYRLVDLSEPVLAALRQRPDESFVERFGQADGDASEAPLVGIGDGLVVTLWETGASALFASSSSTPNTSTAGSRGISLPEQIVGADGSLFIPFAGRVPAAGRSLSQIQIDIEAALRGKTQTPQALVSLSRPVSNAVIVLGEAAGGARLPLSARGERVLDALAALGGSRAPVYETRVRLTRGEVSAELPLARLLADPAQNLRLRAGDQIVVTRQPDTYTAFGATGRNAQIPFDAKNVNLVEAVARAGGLLDQRADPAGVYLLRQEPAALAASLNTVEGAAAPATDAPPVPVIYHLDLTQAGGYFLGQAFDLRDRDVLYVASAESNQLQKFLVLVGLISQPLINGAIIQQTTK